MSDRIAVMNSGRYEQLGDPESLYERPTTRFVAGFLGVSNLLPGTIDGAADSHSLVRLADDTRVRVPRSGAADGTKVDAGVRPEKIRLRDAREDGQAGHNTLLGTIRDASYLGVSTSYIVEIRGGSRLMVYEQNVERATRSELWAPGEEVRLTWAPEHTFVLRAEEAAASSPAPVEPATTTTTEPPATEPADIGA